MLTLPPDNRTTFLPSRTTSMLINPSRIPAYQYSLILVKTLPPGSPDSTTTAVDVIATALRLPTIFDFDSLLKVDGVIAVETHELFSLLQVFLNGGLKEFVAWEASHPGALQKYSKYSVTLRSESINDLPPCILRSQKNGTGTQD